MIQFLAGLILFITVMCIAIHIIRRAYEWMVIKMFRGLLRRKRRSIYVVL